MKKKIPNCFYLIVVFSLSNPDLRDDCLLKAKANYIYSNVQDFNFLFMLLVSFKCSHVYCSLSF